MTMRNDAVFQKSVLFGTISVAFVAGAAFLLGVASVLAQTEDGESPWQLSDDGKTFVRYWGNAATSFAIPDGVETIGIGAFGPVNSLKSVRIPASVKSLGDSPFLGSVLTSIDVAEDNPVFRSINGVLFSKDGKTLVNYPPGRKQKEYVVPDGVETIGKEAFLANFELRTVVFPAGLATIDDGAFRVCGSLRSLVLPDGTTTIGDEAFSSCSSLTEVVLPDSLETIGKGAFQYCSCLESIRIPKGVTSIETGINDPVWDNWKSCNSFAGCENLVSIDVAKDNLVYRSIDGVLFSKDGKKLFKCPEAKRIDVYVVPDGVETIEPGAFASCRWIKSIDVSEGATSIGNYAFGSVETVNLPESLNNLGEKAFQPCYSLTSINVPEDNPSFRSIDGVLFSKDGRRLIRYPAGKKEERYEVPDGVATIDDLAFSDDYRLKTIVLSKDVEKIGPDKFTRCHALTTFEVDGNNPFYRAVSGVLFTKDRSVLVRSPRSAPVEDYVVPEGVKRIDDRAFASCLQLKSVAIPEGVEELGIGAVDFCSSLRLVVLPKSVVVIPKDFFRLTTNLKVRAPKGSCAAE
ncbi:MAG: leucine-rich repeat domain-containing protein, partial [Thermoguttaceae bacterium]|nr:leucine-rich repeat domain-containing protein [Thermoguttaceae bacterium]